MIPVNGILLLDKPLGLSSNIALQKSKRLFNAKKAGHTGSLDPLASGMLPLCFGEATKYTRFLLEEKKCYQTTIQLGVTTNTGDGEGEVIAQKAVPDLTQAMLDDLQNAFLGEQQQIPPMYSALKHKGQPLYKLAREGKEIERKARTITISTLTLDNLEHSNEGTFLTFTVVCTTGTYIRTLAQDMGNYLGCGGYVTMLRRLWVWPFANEAMIPLDALYDLSDDERMQHLIPLEKILPQLLPSIDLTEQTVDLLNKGQHVSVETAQQSGWIALMTRQGALLGIGEVIGPNRIAPRRLCSTADA